MKRTYLKFRFTSRHGCTAGLVIESDKFSNLSITELSRFFPYSESRFMRELEVSREFNSWRDAFDFDFDSLDAIGDKE